MIKTRLISSQLVFGLIYLLSLVRQYPNNQLSLINSSLIKERFY